MTTDVAVPDEVADSVAITADQQRFNAMQIAVLRQLGVEDAPQGDLDLFFHTCKTTGLDPFRKQIFMIGRNTKVTSYVPNADGTGQRKEERWVTKYTIQTGIKGYRKHARDVANQLGEKLSFEGPWWCGEDGQWREVWPADVPPVAAKFVVFRDGEPNSAVVHYSEFVQTVDIYEGSGQARRLVDTKPNSMWAKMPRNQLAKCAEAAAYERAYPDDFDGLTLDVAVQTSVIDSDGNPVDSGAQQSSGGRQRGLAGARAALQQRRPDPGAHVMNPTKREPEVVDSAAAPPATEPDVPPPPAATKRQITDVKRLLATQQKLTVPSHPDALQYVGNLVSREISSLDDLTSDEAKNIITELTPKEN